MTVEARVDSLYQFSDPYYDELQDAYVWGIADPPDPTAREDDQFYTLRDNDRIDLIAHRLLGSTRYFWVILHYNNIPNCMDLSKFVGKEIRLPSRRTLEKVFSSVNERSDSSTNNI